MIERITRVSQTNSGTYWRKKPFAISEYYQHSKESCFQKILVFLTSPFFHYFTLLIRDSLHRATKSLLIRYIDATNYFLQIKLTLTPRVKRDNTSPISTDRTHSSHSHLDCMPRHWKLLVKKNHSNYCLIVYQEFPLPLSFF